MSTPSAGYTLGGASTSTTAPLPTANTIDATQDVLPIYTASLTATQGINRNTFLGITGSPIGNTDSQTLTNKVIGTSNTVTQKDGSFTLQNTADTTKQLQWNLASITAGNTRTVTVPDASLTLVGTATTQTLTNKILTSPIINAPTITNATISADAVTGFSVANTGTIYGIAVTTGTIGNAALAASSVNSTQIASGIQVRPKEQNPYKFSVYRSAAFNVNATSDTKIPFDTKVFDTSSNFDAITNNRFTAPIAGFYSFSSTVTVTATGADAHFITLYKNGAEFMRGNYQISASNQLGNTITGLIQLAASDYIEVFWHNGKASTQAVAVGQATCWFTGFLMSAT